MVFNQTDIDSIGETCASWRRPKLVVVCAGASCPLIYRATVRVGSVELYGNSLKAGSISG